jgi:transposase
MSILPPFPKGQAAQPRFIGLDLHSEEIQCHVLLAEGTTLGSVRFATSASNINKLRDELTAQDAVAMEATFNAFTVAQRLLPSGARVVISDPRKTRAIAEAKIKTDKIDARVLSELLRVDYLPTVWLPDAATLELRHLLSDRQSDVARRTEVKNRIHGVLQRELLKGHQLFSSKNGTELLELLVSDHSPLPEYERARLVLLRQELAHLDELVAAHEKALARFITNDAKLLAQLNRLLTVPGISLVVGAGLLSAIGDVTRFKSGKKLASYFGLVPSTYQSGSSKGYHGPITKQGRALARWLLLEAAEHTVKAPGPLRACYLRLKKKRGHNVAKVAVARKLCEILWHMLVEAEDYLYQIPQRTAEKQARVKYLATGEKAKGGQAKGTPRSAVYGTGLKGRAVQAAAAREVATQVEQDYAAVVTARATGQVTPASNSTAVHPLSPQQAEWNAALAEVTQRILDQAPRRPVARKKKEMAPAAVAGVMAEA